MMTRNDAVALTFSDALPVLSTKNDGHCHHWRMAVLPDYYLKIIGWPARLGGGGGGGGGGSMYLPYVHLLLLVLIFMGPVLPQIKAWSSAIPPGNNHPACTTLQSVPLQIDFPFPVHS